MKRDICRKQIKTNLSDKHIPLRIDVEKYVVASSTEKNTGYIVEKKGRNWICNCKSFEFRSNCSHLQSVLKIEI